MSEAGLAECGTCGRMVPHSELRRVNEEDTQGYFPSGIRVCALCLAEIRYEAFQLEDEDVYDLEDE